VYASPGEELQKKGRKIEIVVVNEKVPLYNNSLKSQGQEQQQGQCCQAQDQAGDEESTDWC